MVTLNFSLSPEATARVHDILQCLAKFGESVSLEARHDKLAITALNSSRTAYASFSLEANTFFISYDFSSTGPKADGRFTCQLYNKVLDSKLYIEMDSQSQALLSAFKGRQTDSRGRDTAVERCDVSIEESQDTIECRLVIKMICRHGVTKTYRLTYESVEIMHALFDKTTAANGWTIGSRSLREYIEYFGSRTEQLDMLAKDGKAIFTSFTEKIMDGKEILKQPLETAIAVFIEEFQDFHAEEDMHIVISVKDFKAIVTHAGTLKTPVSAHFSRPSRPLRISYQDQGMHCEFTLMTTGDYRGTLSSTQPRPVSTRATPSDPTTQATNGRVGNMPPPARPAPHASQASQESQSRRSGLGALHRGISLAPTQTESDGLFVANGDEDERRWEPPDYEADEDMLGWDASGEISAGYHPTFHDTGSHAQSAAGRTQQSRNADTEHTQGLEPTQRLSQLHGLFD